MEFESFPKIGRLNRNMTITEKIDGTNAAVVVWPPWLPGGAQDAESRACTVMVGDNRYVVGAQSRKRLITPTDDNFGFARWVWDHATSLVGELGIGRHFGEWWGLGIQRGYGLDHKQFSLFNTARWVEREGHFDTPQLGVVPTLLQHTFDTHAIDAALDDLAKGGSCAAPGFMDPEGIVIYQHATRTMFKVTIKNDDQPKGQVDG